VRTERTVLLANTRTESYSYDDVTYPDWELSLFTVDFDTAMKSAAQGYWIVAVDVFDSVVDLCMHDGVLRFVDNGKAVDITDRMKASQYKVLN
jgi:N-acyl-L-homoserine lactone synthetase